MVGWILRETRCQVSQKVAPDLIHEGGYAVEGGVRIVMTVGDTGFLLRRFHRQLKGVFSQNEQVQRDRTSGFE